MSKMYKQPILHTKKATVLQALKDARSVIRHDIDLYNQISADYTLEYALTSHLDTIVGKKFKNLISDSGDWRYSRYQNGLSPSARALFTPRLYADCVLSAQRRLFKSLYAEYTSKINKALARGKTFIWLIGVEVIRKRFRLFVESAYYARTQVKKSNRLIHAVHDVIQNIELLFAEYAHENRFDFDRSKLTGDFESFKTYLDSMLYGVTVKEYGVGNTDLLVPDKGLFHIDEHGSRKYTVKFRTHVFNGKTQHDCYEWIDGTKVKVTRFISLYNEMYNIIQQFIKRENKYFTAESIENYYDDTGLDIPVNIDLDIEVAKNSDTPDVNILIQSTQFQRLDGVLTEYGLSPEQSHQFLVYTAVKFIDPKKTHDDCANISRMSYSTYNRIRKACTDEIHALYA